MILPIAVSQVAWDDRRVPLWPGIGFLTQTPAPAGFDPPDLSLPKASITGVSHWHLACLLLFITFSVTVKQTTDLMA
jgi:hypothetical protein